jgi:uncharacterized protein (TIRG00374 family)
MSQLLRALWLLFGLAALGWLCRRFGLSDLGVALERVDVGALCAYACAAVAVLLGYSLRWRSVMQPTAAAPPLRRLVAARLAGDAVGALLPGGKLGGDPLRIALTAGDGRGGVRAGASVALDRFMELIGNSVCAVVCLGIFSLTRAEAASGAPLLLAALLVPLLALLTLVGLLRAGRRPFTPLLGPVARAIPRLRGVVDTLGRTEDQLIGFFRDHPVRFVLGVLASLLIESMILVEYHFLLQAFGVVVDLPTLLVVVVTSGLTRIVPTPGGVGALEAGEVTALGLASGRPDVGFVVGMVLRFHETLWTLLGVLVLLTQGLSVARLRVLAARKAVA